MSWFQLTSCHLDLYLEYVSALNREGNTHEQDFIFAEDFRPNHVAIKR
jgi:hypothetical protein